MRGPVVSASAGSGDWRRILTSFGSLAVGEGVARLLGLATITVVARRLDTADFGVFVIGTTIIAWTALAVDAGTETLAVRDIGRDRGRARAIAEPLLAMRLAVALLLGAIFAGGVLLAGPDHATALALFALVLPALALNPRFITVAVDSSRWVAVGNVSAQALLLGGTVLLVGAGQVAVLPVLMAAGEFLYAVVVLAALMAKVGRLVPRIDLATWCGFWRRGRSLMGTNVARTVIYSGDLLLIALLLGSAEAGIYGAAYKPVLFVSGAIGLFFYAFLAGQGRSVGADRHLTRLALRTVPAVAALVALTLTLGAGTFVSLLYGDAFRASATPLAILAWMLPVQAVGWIHGSRLIAAGAQHHLLRANAMGATANLTANVVLIPVYGIVGAAVVTVCTEIGVHGYVRRVARRAAQQDGPAAPAAQTLEGDVRGAGSGLARG